MEGSNNYPHPNPHFPAPPRPLAKLGCVGVLITGLITLACFFALPFTDGPGWLMLLCVLGFSIGLIALPLMLLERYRARQWRKCRILPVRVTRAPLRRGPGPVLVLLSLLPGLGVVIGVLAGMLRGDGTRAHGLICIGDFVYEIQWEAARHFRRYRQITEVWMLVDEKENVWPIEGRAPKKFWFQPVTPDALEYLDDLIPESYAPQVQSHREAVLEADYREAAKANDRASRELRLHP